MKSDPNTIATPFIYILPPFVNDDKNNLGNNNLEKLFPDLFLHIMKLLDDDATTLCVIGLVCRKMRKLSEDENFWAHKVRSRWRTPPKLSPDSWKVHYITSYWMEYLSDFGRNIFCSSFYDDQHLCVQDEAYRLTGAPSYGSGGQAILYLPAKERRGMFYMDDMKTKEEREEERKKDQEEEEEEEEEGPQETKDLFLLTSPEEVNKQPVSFFLLKTECKSIIDALQFNMFGFYWIDSWDKRTNHPRSIRFNAKRLFAINGSGVWRKQKLVRIDIDKEMFAQVALVKVSKGEVKQVHEFQKKYEEFIKNLNSGSSFR